MSIDGQGARHPTGSSSELVEVIQGNDAQFNCQIDLEASTAHIINWYRDIGGYKFELCAIFYGNQHQDGSLLG